MGRRKKGDKIDGWINLDKPIGLTSTQALGKVRRFLNAQKAGHGGTLDPLAHGILPIALGEATKTVNFAQDHLKTYQFSVKWGEQRDTDDAEGAATASSDARPAKADIEAILADFIGDIEQTPPAYSAIKIDGQRAYDLARDGETPEIKSRQVYIESLTIIGGKPEDAFFGASERQTLDETGFEVRCGKGTYVRSLARDMGLRLGCYGYVSALKRTAVGPFTLDNAISLDFLEKIDINTAQEDVLLPLSFVLDDIPALDLNEREAAKLRNGNVLDFISRPDFERLKAAGFKAGQHQEALARFEGRPVALVDVNAPSVKPIRVFNL